MAVREARNIRMRRKESLPQVARATGLHASSICRFELGKGGMLLENLEMLARHYGCALDDLRKDAAIEPEAVA